MAEAASATELITPQQFHQTDGVEDWRFVVGGASTCFRTGSFQAGARLARAIIRQPRRLPRTLSH
ncbi:MAG: hypothetical protein ACRDT8_20495 [Micromonosporaceae bacterium]